MEGPSGHWGHCPVAQTHLQSHTFLLHIGTPGQVKQHLWTVRLGLPKQDHVCPFCNAGLAQGTVGEVVRWTVGQREELFFLLY